MISGESGRCFFDFAEPIPQQTVMTTKANGRVKRRLISLLPKCSALRSECVTQAHTETSYFGVPILCLLPGYAALSALSSLSSRGVVAGADVQPGGGQYVRSATCPPPPE